MKYLIFIFQFLYLISTTASLASNASVPELLYMSSPCKIEYSFQEANYEMARLMWFDSKSPLNLQKGLKRIDALYIEKPLKSLRDNAKEIRAFLKSDEGKLVQDRKAFLDLLSQKEIEYDKKLAENESEKFLEKLNIAQVFVENLIISHKQELGHLAEECLGQYEADTDRLQNYLKQILNFKEILPGMITHFRNRIDKAYKRLSLE